MSVSVDLGQIALLFVQLIALVITFFVHARQLSALDIEKRDRGTFGARVSEALRLATDALTGVEKIDKEKYDKLAKKHVDSLAEIEELKLKILRLEESVKSLANKLASRERADRNAFRQPETQPENPEVAPKIDGPHDLEWLKAQGIAVPLASAQQQPQTLPPNSVAFGKTVRG